MHGPHYPTREPLRSSHEIASQCRFPGRTRSARHAIFLATFSPLSLPTALFPATGSLFRWRPISRLHVGLAFGSHAGYNWRLKTTHPRWARSQDFNVFPIQRFPVRFRQGTAASILLLLGSCTSHFRLPSTACTGRNRRFLSFLWSSTSPRPVCIVDPARCETRDSFVCPPPAAAQAALYCSARVSCPLCYLVDLVVVRLHPPNLNTDGTFSGAPFINTSSQDQASVDAYSLRHSSILR